MIHTSNAWLMNIIWEATSITGNPQLNTLNYNLKRFLCMKKKQQILKKKGNRSYESEIIPTK